MICLDLLSQELPGWTEANHEKYQLGYLVLVPRYDHWGSRIERNTVFPPISVTQWGSSVTVVTTPLGIRTLFPVGTLNFLVSTKSIPALGPRRDVELTTLASSARVKNMWMYTSILAHSISSRHCALRALLYCFACGLWRRHASLLLARLSFLMFHIRNV